ncbi:MAG: protein kinase domain-containing protein, partial [Gemmatimonadales bacterium]
VEEREDLVFFVMALVDGETLGERIRRRGPLLPDEAERALREMAWALGYAHAHGIVHRDLTVANILLERHTGRALLADFGIAGERGAIESTPTFGTPGYLAPEVIRGESADARSDLYALGVVGFTALAGRAPFQAETTAQLLAKHLVQPVPPLGPLARGASRRLVGAIEACLHKEPADRPADTDTLHAMLERPPDAVTIAPALRGWFTRWERIRPVYAMVTPILGLQTWLLVSGYLSSGLRVLLTLAAITAVLTVTAIPIVMHLMFELAELRQLRQAGFGVDDIRAAAPHWRAELRRDHRSTELRPLASRVIFDLTVVGAAVLLVTYGVIGPNVGLLARIVPGIRSYFSGMEVAAVMAFFWTMTGIGVGFASPGIRVAPDGRFRRLVDAFWRTALATRLGAFAGAGQRARLQATATLHRSTEMVLGLAVDDLWKAMPAALRTGLDDIPALAHALQTGAAEMRDLIEQLRRSEDEVGDEAEIAKLVRARATLDERHRAAITTLECLRLQLLRLLATREHTAELTQQVEAAWALEADVIRNVAGHVEVRRWLKHRPQQSLTPLPTPT